MWVLVEKSFLYYHSVGILNFVNFLTVKRSARYEKNSFTIHPVEIQTNSPVIDASVSRPRFGCYVNHVKVFIVRRRQFEKSFRERGLAEPEFSTTESAAPLRES